MDGLDEQAEAALAKLIGQLFTHETVQINHSSRDVVMLRFTQALIEAAAAIRASGKEEENNNNPSGEEERQQQRMVTKKLVFRSGLSPSGVRMLREALRNCDGTIEELEFCCLENAQVLQDALLCCCLVPDYSLEGGGCCAAIIKRLTLKNFNPGVRRRDRERVASIIGTTLLTPESTATCLDTLEISNYPIGVAGAEILAETAADNTRLVVLRLLDCDLRSDSATQIARLIRCNRNLRELDLSYNRHYLGSRITREMTIKTLVRDGLRHNATLVSLGMRQTRGGEPIDRSEIDVHLDINRYRERYVEDGRDPLAVPPHLWPAVLGRVSPKPSTLYVFLQDCPPTIFAGAS